MGFSIRRRHPAKHARTVGTTTMPKPSAVLPRTLASTSLALAASACLTAARALASHHVEARKQVAVNGIYQADHAG